MTETPIGDALRPEDSDRIIAILARENVALRDQVGHLQDEARRRQEWLERAKREAGFNSTVSFDDVWAKTLAAYKALQTSPSKGEPE